MCNSISDDEEIPSNEQQRQGRLFFNRNRNGLFEQVILIRSDCVARVIGNSSSSINNP